jgi:hypothetical protein
LQVAPESRRHGHTSTFPQNKSFSGYLNVAPKQRAQGMPGAWFARSLACK